MSFLDKIANLNEMRKNAKELQSALGKEVIVGASNDGHFKVTIDGNQNILHVEIADPIVANKFQLEKSAKESFSKALDGLKKLMVSKFSGYMK
ncbi:YbaB/EbfC family nucleoid-associated protein [Candidatus Uhrbacteria bacterium]|nr:YbaB/EbfC family nucleoid-associated protein [Candidatus Uhrbacteria bacterium]